MSETEFIVQEGFRFAVFPSLQFTCETGYVVRLWFLGRQRDAEQRSLRPQIPSFRLFSNLSQSFSNSSALGTALDPQVVLNGRSESAVLTSVVITRSSRESFNFTRGDFIGIMNPTLNSDGLSMLYHNSSGPTVYFQEETTTILLRSSAKSNNYPLLAIETGNIILCHRNLNM